MTMQRGDARLSGALKVYEEGGTHQPAVTKNISTKGLYLITKQRWPVGTEVSLKVVHRHCELVVVARVMHHQADGVGFQFVNPDEESKKKIEFVVESLLADGAWHDERRTSIRTRVEGPVVWRVGSMEVQSRLRDLSPTGAFIETGEPPEVGSPIYIYLPAVDPAEENTATQVCGCQATVMHRSPAGFGIEFVFPSEEFRGAVDRLVRAAGI